MKYVYVSIIVVLVALICIFSFKNKNNTDYGKKIDSLKVEIKSINKQRDSIQIRMDTTVIKIKENERYYKETVNTIINNTTDANYIFFLNYLEENKARYDSINNSDTTKGN